jgi:hypothetical protein
VTGFKYHLDRVLVRRSKRHCSIVTMTDNDDNESSVDHVSFESSHYSFGITADVFLHAQFGPSFIGRGLRVFSGQLRFAYKEPEWKAYQHDHSGFMDF